VALAFGVVPERVALGWRLVQAQEQVVVAVEYWDHGIWLSGFGAGIKRLGGPVWPLAKSAPPTRAGLRAQIRCGVMGAV